MEESKVMKGTSPETMLETYNAAYWSCVPVLLMGFKPYPSTSKKLMEKVDWTSLFNPNSKFYTAIRNALLPLNTEGRTLYLRTFIAHRLSNYSMFNKDDEHGNILCGFVLKAKNILDEQKNLSSVTDEERYIFRLYIHGRQIVENLGELASMCGVDWSAIAKEFGLVRAEEDTLVPSGVMKEDEICKDVPKDIVNLFGTIDKYKNFIMEVKKSSTAPNIAKAYFCYGRKTPYIQNLGDPEDTEGEYIVPMLYKHLVDLKLYNKTQRNLSHYFREQIIKSRETS